VYTCHDLQIVTDLTPQLDAKSSDASSGSKDVSATATSENETEVIPLEKVNEGSSAHHGGGLAAAAELDKLGIEPAQFSVAPPVCYSIH